MDKLAANYEKVALGLALVIALALGAMVYLNAGKLDEDFVTAPSPTNKIPEMAGQEDFKNLAEAVAKPVELKRAVDKDKREIDNFVGIPLFIHRDSPDPVDLGDKRNAPVHPPIPNQWWLDYGIEPNYADSPERDADGDGFSNREEYDAKTSPSDATEHPALIAKLTVSDMKANKFSVAYSADTTAGPINPDATFRFRHKERVNGAIKTTNSEWIKPGEGAASRIFPEGGAQLRYELKAVERRKVVNPRTNAPETHNWAILEDLSPAKKGDKHEIKKGSSNAKVMVDYTAVLALDAIGEGGTLFEVPERTTFSLPYDENAAEKPYTFVGLDADNNAVIEWEENGTKKTKLIPAPAQ